MPAYFLILLVAAVKKSFHFGFAKSVETHSSLSRQSTACGKRQRLREVLQHVRVFVVESSVPANQCFYFSLPADNKFFTIFSLCLAPMKIKASMAVDPAHG